MHTVEEVLGWDGITVIDSLIKTELCKTKSEARRMIEQGAIKVGDIKITDYKAEILFSHDRNKSIVVQFDGEKNGRI